MSDSNRVTSRGKSGDQAESFPPTQLLHLKQDSTVSASKLKAGREQRSEMLQPHASSHRIRISVQAKAGAEFFMAEGHTADTVNRCL